MTRFDSAGPELPIRPDIAAAFEREWHSLASPGSWYSGAERVAVAAEARRAAGGDQPPTQLAAPVIGAVRRLVDDPGSIRREWVASLASQGLAAHGYVETVGVVSRIAAVDGFHRALGLEAPPLPEPLPGEPTNETNPEARPTRAFVPMTRGTSIWWSLALVPDEAERMADIHCKLYLSPEEMQATGSPRAITRPQIELIAARTSVINECFY